MQRLETMRALSAALLITALACSATAQETAAPAHPPQAVELYNEGLELAQTGKYAEARSKFEEALGIAADFTEARYNLGLVLRQLGEKEAAVNELQKSLDGSPQPALACQLLGQTLAELGRTDEAVQAYRDAMNHDETLTNLHYTIADIVYKAAKTDEDKAKALAAYEAALKAAPRDPAARKAYRVVAKMYYKAAAYEKALDAYVKASKLSPKDADLHYNVGVLYNRTGNPKQAIASLKQAIALQNPNGKAYYAMAGIYYNRLKDDEAAADAYEKAAKDESFNKAADAAERAQMIRTYLEQKAAAAEGESGGE